MTPFDRINAQLNRANFEADALRYVMLTHGIDLWSSLREVAQRQLELTYALCAASRAAPHKEPHQ